MTDEINGGNTSNTPVSKRGVLRSPSSETAGNENFQSYLKKTLTL